MATLTEPFPGWTDSLGGPLALSLISAKGIFRSMIGEEEAFIDMIPVDIVTKVLCLAARQQAMCG
jgi:hypothetical protein